MKNKQQHVIDTVWRGMLAICAVMVMTMLPYDVLATPTGSSGTGTAPTNSNVLQLLFCNVLNWMTGPVGKGLATLAIVIIGIGALLGKVAWSMAMIVGIGIALIFGAVTIVNSLGGDTQDCNVGSVVVPATG